MRGITKHGDGGYPLNRAHAQPPRMGDEATRRWQRFRDKPAVLEALLQEQYRLCCYSEIRADEEGLGYHIEHVENKGQKPTRTFDYQNLAASALRSSDLSTFLGMREQVFGGHAPGKCEGVDLARFVSCHQPDSGRYFAYLSDGRVVPASPLNSADRARATYTIELLNLNSPFLITRRRQWWEELAELYEGHVHDARNLTDLAAIELLPTNGMLNRFFSLTRQFFGELGEQVLREDAPELV